MKNLTVLDCEVFPNYFLAAFKNINNCDIFTIEIVGENQTLSKPQIKKLKSLLFQCTTFGFNSNTYDIPIILYALQGKSCSRIYQLSNKIINGNLPQYQTLNIIDEQLPAGLNHFDISQPAPSVMVSLKLYGGRMNSQKIQDLPFPVGSILTKSDIINVKQYCINDLDTTIELYQTIESSIDLRVSMSEEYNQDLRSKSDAQIAETVIKSQLEKHSNKKVIRPVINLNAKYQYLAPDYLEFKSEQLQNIFDIIKNHWFELDKKGSVKLPKALSTARIKLGSTIYKIGIGGLHSQEKAQTLIPKSDELVCDRDAAAYYPNIILSLGLYPKHLGKDFLDVYRDIVERRLAAKKAGDKTQDAALKVTINGSFGKLGSQYSLLYSPDLMLRVTLTGQLALLMLIEELENNSIAVRSANTDGFVSIVPKKCYDLYDTICFNWELATGFILEETQYKALYSRDVNNYLAVTEYGVKGKGIFTLDSLNKNPKAPVCIRAIIEHLTTGASIEDHIRSSTNITDFLTVRKSTGGAVWRGEYLGKVVRWIYSTNGEKITNAVSGNKVASSDGARPLMDLETFPSDIDYQAYITEAHKILDSLGIPS